MKRSKFIQVVKCFSFWKIDKRKGDYKLPSGNKLSKYLGELISDLLNRNHLAIKANGDIGDIVKFGEDNVIFVPFGEDEKIEEQEERIMRLICEIL